MNGTPWEGLILARLSELSPIEHVRAGMPPFLLIHGTADSLVPYSQSVRMRDRMRRRGRIASSTPCKARVTEFAGGNLTAVSMSTSGASSNG